VTEDEQRRRLIEALIDEQHKRIVYVLRGQGAEHEPPPGWQQRVLDQVAQRSWWSDGLRGLGKAIAWVLLAIVVACGLALLVLWLTTGLVP